MSLQSDWKQSKVSEEHFGFLRKKNLFKLIGLTIGEWSNLFCFEKSFENILSVQFFFVYLQRKNKKRLRI